MLLNIHFLNHILSVVLNLTKKPLKHGIPHSLLTFKEFDVTLRLYNIMCAPELSIAEYGTFLRIIYGTLL